MGFHLSRKRKATFFLNCSFRPQFNSSFANAWSENIARNNNRRQNYRTEHLHTYVTHCCIVAATVKWDHVPLFLLLQKNFLIRLHSCTFIYTCLVTRMHLSLFVYIHLWLVYSRVQLSCLVTRMHLSLFVYIHLWLVYSRVHLSTLV